MRTAAPRATPPAPWRFRATSLVALAMLWACSDDPTRSTDALRTPLEPSKALSISSSNFQQCANGNDGGEGCFWINGVLNASKSKYREGDAIAERFVIPKLNVGETYTLVVDWGWQKAKNPAHMNYDFWAGYDVTLGSLANLCGDPLGNGASDIRKVCDGNSMRGSHSGLHGVAVIPDAVFTTNAPLGLKEELEGAIDRFQLIHGASSVRMDIFGGSFPANPFDNATYTIGGDDVTGRMTIRFTAQHEYVLLAWGGHFADELDYKNKPWNGIGGSTLITGAAGQDGAPFHYTMVSITDGKGVTTGIGSLSNNVVGAAVERTPQARISINATATNGIGEPHTFTAKLEKNLDDGFGFVPAADEHIDVTLTPAAGATLSLDAAASTCDEAGDNTDANGECRMVFSSSTAGTITGHASATLVVGGATLSVATGGNGGATGDAVKTFVAGELKWLKRDAAGVLLGGATFTVCRTHNWVSSSGTFVALQTPACVDVTDDQAPDTDLTPGEFHLIGLSLGRYTVKEKTAPAGYTLDPDTETKDLSTTTPSGTIATAFVNPKPGARISISPNATNGIGEAHTFTVLLEKDLGTGAGFVPAAGEDVDFTLTNGGGASFVLDASASTCDDAGANTGADGKCTIVFTSNSAGAVTGSASATLAVGGVQFTVQTNNQNGNSPVAVKAFVAGTLRWLKRDGAGQLLGGATFTVCRTHDWDTPTTTFQDIEDVCVDVTDDQAPDTDMTPGELQLDGLILGRYTVKEKTAPAGYSLDPDTETANLSTTTTSVTIATAFVNPQPGARITITGAATNGIGEAHTFTVLLEKNLGAGGGFVAANGEHVDVTLTNAGGAAYVVNAGASSCDDAGANTDANGKCVIIFTSPSAGTVTGNASSTLTINGVQVTVQTDGQNGSSSSVLKTFVAGSLRWIKRDDAGALLGGAVFTVCRTHNWDSDLNSGDGGFVDLVPDACVDVTDNATPDTDATAGEFQLDGLILGRYTVKEKTPPAGYNLDPDTETKDLSTATPSATISTAFVNEAPDAFITISPENETNTVTESHKFVAVMTAVPKSGSPTITIPDFTITVSPTPSDPGTTTCGDYNATTKSKTCERTINSNVAGTFKANASATATIGSVTLTRDTDPATTNIGAGPNGSGEATKVYVAPNLTILKTPKQLGDAGYLVQPNGTATFTIKVKNTGLGAAFNTVIRDTLPNSGLDWSETNGSCDIATIDADPGAPVVTREELTCTLGTLDPNEEFTVQVSSTVPVSFIQIPDAPVGTPLQIDGNLIDDGAGNDWANVGIVCETAGCKIDDPSGQQDGSFGQGTSEDSPVPSIVDGGVPPEKSDLLRFYIATERFVKSDFLYLAWERVQEPNGTTNMDFELNQSTTLSSNGVTPVRTAGDILVKYDLAKGGDTPVLGFHRWVTQASAGGQSASQACEATNKFPCWGKVVALTSNGTDVAGAINPEDVDDPIDPGATRSLDPRTFGEALINLQASGIFQPGVCLNFGRAYLKSRSSDSFTAAIKDFVRPVPISINTCKDVEITNTAWVSASNFTPTSGPKSGVLGGGIFDTGKIKVQAPMSSSMLRPASPSGERYATVTVGREHGPGTTSLMSMTSMTSMTSMMSQPSAAVAQDERRHPLRRASTRQGRQISVGPSGTRTG